MSPSPKQRKCPARANKLLDEAEFDTIVESLCQPHYAMKLGQPSIPPEVHFRMLFIGYMEGLSP